MIIKSDTSNNFNDDLLNAKRQLGDSEADDFVRAIFTNPLEKKRLQELMVSETHADNLVTMMLAYPNEPLIANARNLPEWADPGLMRKGSALFARHSEMIMSLLGLLSLPYCYTAANGAMVLYLTELIRKQTTKRLFDTAIFIWEVMGPGAFNENGKAYGEILKVRIIHAFVRHYMLTSGKWDQAWGFPINQEDMAGTNLSFSLIVLRGLRMLGYKVSKADEHAFLHVWAVIGFLSGLDKELITDNYDQANYLDARIKERQFTPSAHGKELTQALIEHIMSVNESKATEDDIRGLMRYLLGEEISDHLSIAPSRLAGYKLSLIRLLGAVKSRLPAGNLHQRYEKAFSVFKLRKPGGP